MLNHPLRCLTTAFFHSQELDSSHHRASVAVMGVEARAADALAAARAEHDATLARNLSFMVRGALRRGMISIV